MTKKEIFEKQFTEDVINASQDTIFVFNPQPGKAVIWNKAFSEVSGYSDKEIKTLKAPNSYYNEDDLRKAESALKQVLKIGKTTVEMNLITKDGRKIPYEYSGTTLQGSEGNPLIVSVGRNISERKEIERKLQESEEKYRSLFENMNAGFAFHEVIVNEKNKPIDYKYLEVNPKFEELTGLKKENLIGKKVTEAIPGTENDPADWIGRFGNVGLTGNPIMVEDYSKAIEKWFKVSGYSPKKGYFAVTFTDITDMKIAEQKLKESEEKFRSLVETTSDWIWEIDKEGKYTYSNPKVKEILGYEVSEIIGKTPFELMPSEETIRVSKMFQEIKEQQKSIESIRNRNIHKNGKIKTLETSGIPIFDEDGSLIGYRGIDRDITEKVETEQKMKESEEKYRSLAEGLSQTGIGIDIIDINHNVVYQNQFLKDQFGEIHNKKCFEFFLGKEEPCEDCPMRKAIQDKKVAKSRIVSPNNRIYEIISAPLFNQSGKIEQAAEVIIDITERVESEKKSMNAQIELAKSYDRLKELDYIINSSPGVVFLWQNSEGWPVEFVSENVKQFGYTQEDFYSGKVIYNQIIHPDDLERVGEEVNLHSNENVSEFEQEYRIITKDGEVKWLDDRSWIRRDSEGKITHYQGIVLDITERKRAEEALKQSESNYKKAYELANFYKDLFTHDMNNILQIINSSAEIISFQLGDSEKSLFIENMTKMIKSQIDRGSKLISDVRTLTSLDEEEININKINITSFLKNSIKFVRRAYTGRKISIITEDLNEKHFTNANELLQDVFDNILINAVKYNEKSTVELHIKISKHTEDKRDYIQVGFVDNGIGVSDVRKKLIFQPGHREIKGSKGMGIGLSLVSKIMEIFNGKIWVEDKVKGDYTQGSKFIVLLPEAK